jgi:hypothetical protein
MWKLLRKVSVVALALAFLLPGGSGGVKAGQLPLVNLACMTTATTGTGTVTLGSAVSGFLSFAGAGVTDGSVVTYAIEDGVNSEVGRGTYTTSGTTLSRPTIYNSTNAGSAISLSGSAKVCVTPSAGDFQGASNYFIALSANQTGSDVNTAQSWFPGGTETFTLPGTTSYHFEGQLSMLRSAGTTAHTIGLLFGGTATLTSIQYIAETTVTNSLAASSVTRIAVGTNTAVTASNSDANEANIIRVRGIVRINAGGTFIPQFQYSAAPNAGGGGGGNPTIHANSYFRLWPMGSNTITNFGPVT